MNSVVGIWRKQPRSHYLEIGKKNSRWSSRMCGFSIEWDTLYDL